MNKKRLKILLVEDDFLAQKVAELILGEMGWIVDFASTGAKALEKVKEQHYDLIFMDIGLDDSDGFTIAKLIGEGKNLNIETPIFGLTANFSSPGMKQCCLDARMVGMLSKPLTKAKCKKTFAKCMLT